uniref:Uncharacterized protein n=1 Tax=Brassica oleracea var. oleracea TaxID=109376 RepID=A0A0D3CHN7_BRAOL
MRLQQRYCPSLWLLDSTGGLSLWLFSVALVDDDGPLSRVKSMLCFIKFDSFLCVCDEVSVKSMLCFIKFDSFLCVCDEKRGFYTRLGSGYSFYWS